MSDEPIRTAFERHQESVGQSPLLKKIAEAEQNAEQDGPPPLSPQMIPTWEAYRSYREQEAGPLIAAILTGCQFLNQIAKQIARFYDVEIPPPVVNVKEMSQAMMAQIRKPIDESPPPDPFEESASEVAKIMGRTMPQPLADRPRPYEPAPPTSLVYPSGCGPDDPRPTIEDETIIGKDDVGSLGELADSMGIDKDAPYQSVKKDKDGNVTIDVNQKFGDDSA